ncbi:hypothetical protein PALI_a1318 [Pseudoalteromonas aliena SW19]|uniref:Uncharacterized protein n=1 Tax=Pseudoalteromonas aliena SW19 TaxID=1314866 RepID=A0ABR9E0L4_9GAMM|nr:hypothetical protein [Pseudoalteromonas aliena SW19]
MIVPYKVIFGATFNHTIVPVNTLPILVQVATFATWFILKQPVCQFFLTLKN